jgi:hypothetical protein
MEARAIAKNDYHGQAGSRPRHRPILGRGFGRVFRAIGRWSRSSLAGSFSWALVTLCMIFVLTGLLIATIAIAVSVP